MKIIKIIFLFLSSLFILPAFSAEPTFQDWLKDFKIYALKNNISKKTLEMTMTKVIYLPNVIKYDRFQPEFYEDTKTYISKRTSNQKIKEGRKLYEKNKNFIDSIDIEFSVEKYLLLSLMGIETNFGNYVGKIDILSSLATLSFDKRRSDFFTNELITVLKLVDSGDIDHKILYGSWAGAFGNFQFMPTTIDKYAIDYDKNNIIELKSIKDSFASAANYINKIGWKKNQPCFISVNLSDDTPKKILNTSAKKIHSKKKFKYLKKYILGNKNYNFNNNLVGAIITPDKDIVSNADNLKPAYIVFENYEKVLQWNRSLRFGLAVCTLKDKFKNVL
jgi:membrane-bound lytic murein transglycosylase B